MTGEILLREFDHEMANSRKVLERLPEEHLGWKPHEKSWTLGQLAGHVANIPTWAIMTLEQTGLDLSTPFERPELKTAVDILAHHDRSVAAARTVLKPATHEQLMVDWTLSRGEHTVFTMPRVAVLRSMVMNHTIHHRGQVTVYLRMLDVPLPSIYGPTADEQ